MVSYKVCLGKHRDKWWCHRHSSGTFGVESNNNLRVQWTLDTSWWRHQMEKCSALLALCVGNSPVTGEFPAQRPVTQSFDVFFDLHLNKHLSKQCEAGDFRTRYDVIVMITVIDLQSIHDKCPIAYSQVRINLLAPGRCVCMWCWKWNLQIHVMG